jgi:hypothetical protein
MRRREPRAQLARDRDAFVPRQSPDAPQHRAEVLAIDALHRNVGRALDLAEIVHQANVGMRDFVVSYSESWSTIWKTCADSHPLLKNNPHPPQGVSRNEPRAIRAAA